jgi:hypothetical protein
MWLVPSEAFQLRRIFQAKGSATSSPGQQQEAAAVVLAGGACGAWLGAAVLCVHEACGPATWRWRIAAVLCVHASMLLLSRCGRHPRVGWWLTPGSMRVFASYTHASSDAACAQRTRVDVRPVVRDDGCSVAAMAPAVGGTGREPPAAACRCCRCRLLCCGCCCRCCGWQRHRTRGFATAMPAVAAWLGVQPPKLLHGESMGVTEASDTTTAVVLTRRH